MRQSNRPYEGLFITIEGGDGSGKTTVCNYLVSQLTERGYQVERTREPGGTPLSEHIRELLLDPNNAFAISPKAELLLYLAARSQHLELSIKPALMEGKIVLCERFNDSTIAYQGCARHLGMNFVENLCNQVAEDPDLTLLLDLDPEKGMDRILTSRKEARDRFEREHLPFHRDVRQGYLHLADKHPDRIVVIDAALPIEQVKSAALKALEALLKPAFGRLLK